MICLKFIILVILSLTLLSLFMSAHIGNRTLFHPSKRVFYVPEQTFNVVYVNGVVGFHFNNFPGKKTVLYCHGNNANITSRKYIIDLTQSNELNLLLFDYQGYGFSDGSPYQQSLIPDAVSMMEFLLTKTDVQNIVVWGESLGGNCSAYLASKYNVSRLILLSTFSSIPDTISDLGFVGHSFTGKFFDPFNTLEYLNKIKCPVTIIHSKDDEMIPYTSVQRMVNTIKTEKVVVDIEGKHGNPSIHADALKKIVESIK